MNIRQAFLNEENVCTQVGSLRELKAGGIVIDDTADVMGMLYNVSDGSWSVAPLIPPPPIRVITKRSFMKRIAQADRVLIRKSVDDIVIDIHEDLKSASSVDLDDPDTVAGAGYLESVNLLTSTNMINLFIDGTEKESYS